MFSMFQPCFILFVFTLVECSIKKSPLRIFGGSNAGEGEYPYVVRMERQGTGYDENSTIVISHFHICTASALSSTWVLTAGHCVHAAIKHRLDVVIRYGHVENSPVHEDTFSNILLKIIHPSYKYSFTENPMSIMKNDIALMKTTPMKVNSFGKLSAVDFLSLYGHEAILAGYGITTSKLLDGKTITNNTLNLLKPLQIIKVLINKCSRISLRPAFCLAPKCGSIMTACGGDSGGPLIHPTGVIGVVSLGEPTRGCLSPTRRRRAFIAGYILPISPYIEWIQSYVTAKSK